MENASKALFIAAGVILALMVLSIGVYLFITFGQAASNTHKQVKEEQLNQFNSQFTIYQGRDNLNIYDIITIANLATQNNINNEIKDTERGNENSYYIAVDLDDRKISNPDTNQKKEFGYGATQTEIEEKNQGAIKFHTNQMIGNGYTYYRNSQLQRSMPQIKCEYVSISSSTRKSI